MWILEWFNIEIKDYEVGGIAGGVFSLITGKDKIKIRRGFSLVLCGYLSAKFMTVFTTKLLGYQSPDAYQSIGFLYGICGMILGDKLIEKAKNYKFPSFPKIKITVKNEEDGEN